jgi:hypothetical protein
MNDVLEKGTQQTNSITWEMNSRVCSKMAPPSPRVSREAWKATRIFLSLPMGSGRASEVYSCPAVQPEYAGYVAWREGEGRGGEGRGKGWALNEADRKLAASNSLLNPNRHRATAAHSK